MQDASHIILLHMLSTMVMHAKRSQSENQCENQYLKLIMDAAHKGYLQRPSIQEMDLPRLEFLLNHLVDL
jgi:hypothetical protein